MCKNDSCLSELSNAALYCLLSTERRMVEYSPFPLYCVGQLAAFAALATHASCCKRYKITGNINSVNHKHTCNNPSVDATRRTDSRKAMLCSGFLCCVYVHCGPTLYSINEIVFTNLYFVFKHLCNSERTGGTEYIIMISHLSVIPIHFTKKCKNIVFGFCFHYHN